MYVKFHLVSSKQYPAFSIISIYFVSLVIIKVAHSWTNCSLTYFHTWLINIIYYISSMMISKVASLLIKNITNIIINNRVYIIHTFYRWLSLVTGDIANWTLIMYVSNHICTYKHEWMMVFYLILLIYNVISFNLQSLLLCIERIEYKMISHFNNLSYCLSFTNEVYMKSHFHVRIFLGIDYSTLNTHQVTFSHWHFRHLIVFWPI